MNLRTSLRLASSAGYIALAASCRETTNPVGQIAKATILSAASPTQLTGTVGTPVTNAPSVVVRDAAGQTVAGAVVTFSIKRGGGTLQGPRVVTRSDGIARVAVWTLGTTAGMNTIAATSDFGNTVVFTADAVAGAPSQLEKVDGDAQVALPGTALGARPQVRVTDSYGNGLAGVTVTFAVEAGGGSVSAPVAVSDAAGIAESGAWVLGSPGVQRMVARAGELASEPFTARAVTPPFGCAPSDALLTQANVQVELTALSCKGTDGRSLDAYTVVVTKPGAYVFTLTSVEFDTDLELRGADLVELARNDNSSAATTTSEIKALLPQGTYTLVVSSPKLGAGGHYHLAYRLTSSDVESCEEAFIVRGTTARGVVSSSDCTPSPDELADRFRIYLEAGSQVEIRVEDFSYSGPNVRIVSPDGSIGDAGPGGNYLTRLAYQAPVNGYYTVLVGLLNEYGVVYEITVR